MGGALLYVQNTGCYVQPSFSEPKPGNLAMIPDVTWKTFHDKVEQAASNLYSEKVQLIGFASAVPLLLLPRLLLGDLWANANLFGLNILLGLLACAAFLGPMYWIVQKNKVQDESIMQACNELARAAGVSVEYRTAYTGFCKPKGASPFRAIAITPASKSIPPASTHVVE